VVNVAALALLTCEALLSNAVFTAHSTEALRAELGVAVTDANRGDVIEVVLTQDATHILASVPGFVPDRALLYMGKRALAGKMKKLLGLKRKDPRQPEIVDMLLENSRMIVRLRVRREYLAPVLGDYVKSLNHPALGNFIIAMELAK
jgi:hypothetical protein